MIQSLLFRSIGGAIIAVLTAQSAVIAASKSGTTSNWSGAAAISPVCQPDPTRGAQLNDVAVNVNGAAIAAWDQYTYNGSGGATIGAATQASGKWSPPFTISDATGFSISPKVAVGAGGTMAVSWTSQDSVALPSPQQRIQVAVRPAGSSIWKTSTLAQGPIGGVAITQSIPLAVDPYGNVTAAWSLWNGVIHNVQSAIMLAGGGWSPPSDLAPGVDGMFPSLAINSRGDAGVAFCISAWSYSSSGTSALYVFRPRTGGAWTSPVIVSESLPSSVGYVSNPLVALDANGLATVAYFAYGVEAVRQLSSTSWTAPQVVLPSPTPVSSFGSIDLSADQSGNAVVVASVFDASVGVDRSSVWAALGAPGGTWSAPQRLTDPAANDDAYGTRAAISPDGALTLVGWVDHYHGVVQVSKLVNGLWGAANTIGRGTAFSSFQEVLSLDASSGTTARAVWKYAKAGTQTMAASYGR